MIKHAQQTLHQILLQRKTAAVRPFIRGLIERAGQAGRNAGQNTVDVLRRNPMATAMGATAATTIPASYAAGRLGGFDQGAEAGLNASAPVRPGGSDPVAETPGMIGQGLSWLGENWLPVAGGAGLGLGGLALANYLMEDDEDDQGR